MRSIKPLCLTAAVALALSSGAAFAQARVGTGTTGTTAAATTGSTTTTGTTSAGAIRAGTGGCAGSGGSTCTATTTNPSTTGTTGTSGTPGSEGSVGSPATVGDTVTQTSTGRVQGQTGTTTTVDSGKNRPDPFGPNGAFAGSGTTSGAGATGSTSGTGNEPGTGNVNGNVNGVGIVPGTALGTETSVNPASQQNVFVQPQQGQSGTALSSTPIFDQAAREGRARDARRRATGDVPRVIGIAPRTDRDLTYQMPDDPIIRY